MSMASTVFITMIADYSTEQRKKMQALAVKITKLLESEHVTLTEARIICKAVGTILQKFILDSVETTPVSIPEGTEWYYNKFPWLD